MKGTFWIATATIVALIGDYYIKRASDAAGKESIIILIIATLIYSVSTLAFFFSYKYASFSSVAVYFSIGTILVSVAIGILAFKETLTLGQWAGVLAGIISIILMSKFSA